MKQSVTDIVLALLIVVLFLIGSIFIVRTATLEAKLQAIEAIAYSNAYEQHALYPILDIIDGDLGEE